MRSETAPPIRLEDYQPAAYEIEEVELDFKLHPTSTLVNSTLKINKRKNTNAGQTLFLDGEELKLISLKLNGDELDTGSYKASPLSLEIFNPPSSPFELAITTEISPASNTELMGLYQSSDTYCTQCEAEGFRRITYFLDRPDIMSVYTTRIEAPKSKFPILLSNGNLVESGAIPGSDKHYATWHDPHPKPCYLFALVAGDLAYFSDSFTTKSGDDVPLNIYVEHGNEHRCAWAMDALKRSMKWDEDVFGRIYDLDVFNIVAVSNFNMGAMENKGLNIFNDKYVLADADTATDQDYANIEAVIAHEYFHNWTGNRVTCRDWFQLCLKEGLTVYRDQEFTADMRSRPVKRISDVRLLKAHQFPEDAGPLAHPVRPRAYHEINNFYTATVYEKGAEVVRMLATLLGKKQFQAGLDLYFDRHDHDATTIEAFLACFEEVASIDLEQFSLWYDQAGTPTVKVETIYDQSDKTFTVRLHQSISPLPNQKTSKPAVIPLRFGLVSSAGKDLEINSARMTDIRNDVLLFKKRKQEFVFQEIDEKPHLSILRQFSAPVRLEHDQTQTEKVFLASYDPDPFNRWQAIQMLAMEELIRLTKNADNGKVLSSSSALIEVFENVLDKSDIDDAMRALLLTLPSEADIAQELGRNVNPHAILHARTFLRQAIAQAHNDALLACLETLKSLEDYSPDAASCGKRALSNRILSYLAVDKTQQHDELIWRRFLNANNMTDRYSALTILVHNDMRNSDAALKKYLDSFLGNPLAMDKWFMVQATAPTSDAVEKVESLKKHHSFSISSPNKVRSLLQTFAAGNPSQFARADGAGFALVANAILEIDQINPQVASRLLTSFRAWRSLSTELSVLAENELSKISMNKNLSRDCRDIVERTLQ